MEGDVVNVMEGEERASSNSSSLGRFANDSRFLPPYSFVKTALYCSMLLDSLSTSFLLGTTLCAGFEYPHASGCWYHWHCPQGCEPSQRILRLLHSTHALLVDMRRDPGGRDGLPEASMSASGDRIAAEDWKVWNMSC